MVDVVLVACDVESEGSFQERVMVASPAVAVRPVGAAGTSVDAAEASLGVTPTDAGVGGRGVAAM